MLGSHTKRINSYGKRSQRIVDVSDRFKTGEIPNIFVDMPPSPKLAPILRKMKNRENCVPTKPKPRSPKVVGLQKKKRLSPVLSPVRKKKVTRITQIVDNETKRKNEALARNPTRLSNSSSVVGLSLRAPLSTFSAQTNGSPALSTLRTDKASALQNTDKVTTPKLRKNFTPFVDMDIIILDEAGRTVEQEKRTLRRGTSISSTIKQQTPPPRLAKREPEPISVGSDSSNSEVISQPKRTVKRVKRTAPVIISDDSDDEDIPPFSRVTVKPARARVEVLIPKAPYKIPIPDAVESSTSKMHPISYPRSPPSTLPAFTADNQLETYQIISSPAPRQRQLTPIRGSRKPFERSYLPSPSTPTDLDLSFDLSSLEFDTQGYPSLEPDIPEYLYPLLKECHQEHHGPHDFSSFIESFPYDPILHSSSRKQDVSMMFRKVGEASYSEVFGIGDVVLKVIPLQDPSRSAGHMHPTNAQVRNDNSAEKDGPSPSDVKDVRKEIIVTRAMGEVYNGFVVLLKTYVVRGRYPQVLLDLWDEYNERRGSESVRPDTFTASQTYAIIVLPNGGADLEAYTFSKAHKIGWRQACSIFWQVAKALSHAENLVSFEHRDLHWGQILVKDLEIEMKSPLKTLNTNLRRKAEVSRLFMDDIAHGVETTIIDLGLSRMDSGDGRGGDPVHWTPFDEEVFMGEGDYQFEIYRMMRDVTREAWDGYFPITNVMWLHYISQKLLHSKGLKPPTIPRKTKGTSESSIPPIGQNSVFTEKECYDCLVDINDWLGKCLSELCPSKAIEPPKGKGKRKTQALTKPKTLGPACAGEVVEYGVKKGWIKSTYS